MTEEESLLAAINENVELHSYDSSWPKVFEAERERLMSLFQDVFIDIQHIGSTAIPGLTSKPIIDIIAGVESISIAERLALPLCESGYNTSAEFNESLSDRKWFMRWANGHRTHHLHLVVHGSKIWHERLKFRDKLRSNSEYAARYAELKTKLAIMHSTDREAYTNAKEEFVVSILREA
ncbi:MULTISPECIES: GrpB family protein [unclassified Pseudomonas]|uniref:GrpB family protein n=1 Tax=unclassified Pseudomonas TaxID=196821 RepID=UPI00257FDE5C|nr:MULTISPECIES: GrpB family protein [unclassified Pseudomonas]